jgi:hypothetical protein
MLTYSSDFDAVLREQGFKSEDEFIALISRVPAARMPQFQAWKTEDGSKIGLLRILDRALFLLGDVSLTPGALQLLSIADVCAFLEDHRRGKWGLAETATNETALRTGGRLISQYCRKERMFFVLTEADRSCTTVMLEEEY